MTNNLQIVNYDNSQVELIKKTVAIGATDLELQLFISQCKRTGLDALTRQIYFIKGKDGKVQIQTSIDGFRLVAERSGEYEGQTCPQWCGKDGVWKDVWLSNDLPSAARVGVYKKNFREALYGIALFDEYAQRKNDGSLNYMWDRMPALMISKVAESLALRKAFPNDLSGLYTIEEMGQAEQPKQEKVINGHTVVAPKAKIETAKIENKTGDELRTVGTGPATIGANGVVQSNPPSTDFDFSGASSFSQGEPFPMDFDARDGERSQKAVLDCEKYVVKFGKKYMGRTLGEIGKEEISRYSSWLRDSASRDGKPISAPAAEFLTQADAFLSS